MMTPEQQNIAIAEKLGWTKCNCLDVECPYWIPPDIGDPKSKNWCLAHLNLPNFTGDLNAMHTAEKCEHLWTHAEKYAENLAIIAKRECVAVWNVSAAGRSESFCRTFWPEKFDK